MILLFVPWGFIFSFEANTNVNRIKDIKLPSKMKEGNKEGQNGRRGRKKGRKEGRRNGRKEDRLICLFGSLWS